MADSRTELERLACIEEKLDEMPGLIEAAVARGTLKMAEELGRHDERIKAIKQRLSCLEARLWQIAIILGAGLLGEFVWFLHTGLTQANTQ